MDKHFQQKYNIKCHSMSGSRMVGEAFLKSLSVPVMFFRREESISITACKVKRSFPLKSYFT